MQQLVVLKGFLEESYNKYSGVGQPGLTRWAHMSFKVLRDPEISSSNLLPATKILRIKIFKDKKF